MNSSNDTDGRPRRHERRELARHAADLLGTLGDDQVTVARSLAAAGVTGEPADARRCALATYLRAVMQGDARVGAVRVFHDRVVISCPGRLRQRRVTVMLPAPARSFVAGFDAEQYPTLVRHAELSPRQAGVARQALGGS
jgi:hypothetical protein